MLLPAKPVVTQVRVTGLPILNKCFNLLTIYFLKDTDCNTIT